MMGDFYDNLAAGCTKFYSDASKKYAQDAKEMLPTVTALGKHKHVIMNYAR
jgi:hypothetical protein